MLCYVVLCCYSHSIALPTELGMTHSVYSCAVVGFAGYCLTLCCAGPCWLLHCYPSSPSWNCSSGSHFGVLFCAVLCAVCCVLQAVFEYRLTQGPWKSLMPCYAVLCFYPHSTALPTELAFTHRLTVWVVLCIAVCCAVLCCAVLCCVCAVLCLCCAVFVLCCAVLCLAGCTGVPVDSGS